MGLGVGKGKMKGLRIKGREEKDCMRKRRGEVIA